MKIIPKTYTFNKTAKTITCADFSAIEAIALITNLNTGTIIYQFNNSNLGGTLVDNVLTLDYDTSGMSNTDKLQIIINDEILKTAGGALLVGNAKTKWRFEGRTWGGASDEIWDLVQTGSGHTIQAMGNTGGSRYLNINTGVTASSETIIISKETFRPPLNFSFGLTMSQRIANQEVHIELVEVNSNGSVVTDTEFFTAPNFNDARSGVGLKFDGTSANNASLKVRSRGISELVKAAASHGTGFTTATVTTNPNYFPTLQGEISFTADRVISAGRAIDSNASRTEGGRSTTYVPDPDVSYKLRLRVKNLSTAPASATDVRFHFGKIIDQTRLSVDFGAIAGSLNGSDAIPTYLMNPTSSQPNLSPSATYGHSTYHILATAPTTNATLVKSSAGNIGSVNLTNNGTNYRYFKIYNKSSAPTVGTDTPVHIIGIPPSSSITHLFGGAYGIRLSTGIAYAIVGGISNSDTTAVVAGEIAVSINYT